MTQSIDRRAVLASAGALAAALAAPKPASADGAASGPPIAPVRPIVETLWGTKVVDPYRWM